MKYEIVTQVAEPRPLAAVRRRVHLGGVSAAWRPALDLVWAFIRRNEGLWTDGHNIFVYHHPRRPGEPMTVEFGVQVAGPFAGDGEVVATTTPAGLVASTVHVGSYESLSSAHDAIDSWRAAHGLAFGPASWEIYGDPQVDPAKNEVEVVYLLG